MFIVLIMFLVVINSSFAASISSQVILRSSGEIADLTKPAYRSELRGMFFHGANYGHDTMIANWSLIAQTCSAYGITDAFVDLGGLYDGIGRVAMLPNIISAFHHLNIRITILWNTLCYGRSTPTEMRAQNSFGSYVGWGCPIRAKNFTIDCAKIIASYDIDGFMFDYTRYDSIDMCYCSNCRDAFEKYLGENITNWALFYPGGARHSAFLHWRVEPVTELVDAVRKAMLEINPNLEFSASVFPLGDNVPIFWKKFIGQDTANWIRNGYLDSVAPMIYTGSTDEIAMRITDTQTYWTAGKEGQLPLHVFVSNCFPSTLNTTQFNAVIETVRNCGADGWIIWRYGGPGNNPNDNAPDIRPYLEALNKPEIFNIKSIRVTTGQTGAIISWITDKPTTSKVEYSNSPLYNWTYRLWWDTYYWHPEYITGTIIENGTLTYIHTIVLTNLTSGTKYYFKVQSQNLSGNTTSKVLTFTTKS